MSTTPIDMRKLESMEEFREAVRTEPQMRIKIAAAIASVLQEHNLRLTGPVLGDMNFISGDESEQLGLLRGDDAWTI